MTAGTLRCEAPLARARVTIAKLRTFGLPSPFDLVAHGL